VTIVAGRQPGEFPKRRHQVRSGRRQHHPFHRRGRKGSQGRRRNWSGLDSAQLEEQINQPEDSLREGPRHPIQSDKELRGGEDLGSRSIWKAPTGSSSRTWRPRSPSPWRTSAARRTACQHTQRMFRKGYVSPLQLETQQFAVERSKLDLDSARPPRTCWSASQGQDGPGPPEQARHG